MEKLLLRINPVGWVAFQKRQSASSFSSKKAKVLERDKNTCCYCGFSATSYFEVVNRDGNYSNNSFDNLLTACPLCSQCLFIESVGKSSFGGGRLAYIPELSQGDLNAIALAIFLTIAGNKGHLEKATQLYRSLKDRISTVEKEFGDGYSDPQALISIFFDQSASVEELNSSKIFKGLRILPNYAKYKDQLNSWLKELAGAKIMQDI